MAVPLGVTELCLTWGLLGGAWVDDESPHRAFEMASAKKFFSSLYITLSMKNDLDLHPNQPKIVGPSLKVAPAFPFLSFLKV